MKILLFGDTLGISQLLRHLPRDVIAGIIGSSIRPQYIDDLRALANSQRVPFLLQPKWKSKGYQSFIDRVYGLAPDLIWVNSYSMILREDLLLCARLGGINLHASLLPRNRGCNPIQWAILNGDCETGVSLHEIDHGLDTGPIIDMRKIPLFFEDSWLDVSHRLENAADVLITKNIANILTGNWSAISQINKNATVGKRRNPADSLFLWSQPLVEIYNKVRALLPPLPSAFYQDAAGQTYSLGVYQTIWQLALLKYELGEEWAMQAEYVRLRPLRKSDADLFYEWIINRNFVTHNSPFFPVSESNREVWIEQLMTKHSDLVIFVIEDSLSGHPIGACQLVNINWIHRSAELQIQISDSSFQHWRYESEAIKLLSEFGFADLKLHRIYLTVFASNQTAIETYEKCGFECHGTLKEAAQIDGRWVDGQVMVQLESQHND